jgi:hypothetical protein
MANANQSQPPVTYDQISGLFGIEDKNQSIKVPIGSNVFSTNVFIPMEGKIDHKTYFYLSGMVKLVETFQERINNSGLKNQGWMLFIYYDSMFDVDSSYNNSVYTPTRNNNNTNTEIKTNYDSNKEQLKQLLQLYKNYLKIIRLNTGGKYSFVKLYSFNCSGITRKGKGYLGHPSTFGSMVRFMPMFDPQIKRMFCINISHAISPRLCYLISEWVVSEKLLLTKENNGYNIYNYQNIGHSIESIFGIKLADLFNPRIPAGLFGIYKNQNISIIDNRLDIFYKKINYLIEKYNSRENSKVFVYGIDEILLGFIFKELGSTSNSEIKKLTNERDNLINERNKLIDERDELNDEIKSNKAFINNKIKSLRENSIELNLQIENETKSIEKHIYPYFIEYNIYTEEPKKIIDVYYMLSDGYLNKNFMKGISCDKIITELNKENNTINFLYSYSLLIKYQPELTDDQLEKLREQIDQLKINFAIKLKEKYPMISDTIINYIIIDKINLQYHDIDEHYIKQLKKLDLYKPKLLSWITNNKSNHRFVSREFMKSINQDEIIMDFLGTIVVKLYDFDTLLDSFDEMKPLIILTKTKDASEYALVKGFPEYFTFMSSDEPKLLCKLLKYYKDHTKVLPIPYEMLPEVQAGGKRKIRTIKKSKHINRKLTKTKTRIRK